MDPEIITAQCVCYACTVTFIKERTFVKSGNFPDNKYPGP